jgi:peptidoglycan/LPS O-acetylase OafA/YrhL
LSVSQRGGLIANIQALRAFAALMVVFLHLTSNEGLQTGFSFGKFGIDVFFVISGFIISQITAVDSSNFFLKRLIRIVPFYWAATFAIFIVAHFAPHVLRHATANATTLAYSLFFIPHDRPPYPWPWPLMALGWTLNYEMYFYAIFAVALKLSAPYAKAICAAAILCVFGLTHLIDPHSPAEAYYGNPIVLEFIYGMIVFEILRRLPKLSHLATRRDRWFIFTIAVLAIVVVWLPFQELMFGYEHEYLTAGVPAAIGVAAVLILELRYGFASKNYALLLLGEVSYVLYLSHPYVIFGIVRVIAPHSVAWPDYEKWALAAIAISAACGVATIIHIWFERPIMATLRRRLLHKPPPVIFEIAAPEIPSRNDSAGTDSGTA